MLFTALASAHVGDDADSFVLGCTSPSPVVRAFSRLQSSPTDKNVFTEFFMGVNERLERSVEARYRLGGDDGQEVVQSVMQKVWTGEIRWEGAAPTTEDQIHTWLMKHAGAEISKVRGAVRGKGQVKIVNVTADAQKGEDSDVMGGMENSAHTGEALSQPMIDLLPDALHRLVLMRIMQGKTQEAIALELGKPESTIGSVAREARESLSQVLKGRDPIVRTTHRDAATSQQVEAILERELAVRPSLMPEGALKVTEEKFWEVLGEQKEINREVLHDYFFKGKRGWQIARERGLEHDSVRGILGRASKKLAGHFFGEAESDVVGIDLFWIVNAEGRPVSPFRQLDYARVPTAPVEISGEAYWNATKDLDPQTQEILRMRFIEGLSAGYIEKALRVPVAYSIAYGMRHLSAKLQMPLTAESLVVTGDTSMVHTIEVKIPAKLYLRRLAEGGDPSEEAKLELASRISGLPIKNLGRITLVDARREPIPKHLTYWLPLPEAPEKIDSADFKVIQSRLSAEDAELLDLHLRHRWATRSLVYHTGKSYQEIDQALVRGRVAIEKQMGRYVGLPSIVIEQSKRRSQTIQVAGEELRQKVSELDHPSLGNLQSLLLEWKNRKLESLDDLELVNGEGKRLFSKGQDTVAPAPKEPITMTVEDFERGLTLSQLTDLEIKAMRMRFRYGWGSSAVGYLLGYSPTDLRKALVRGTWSLAQKSGRETIPVDGLLLVPTGPSDIVLQKVGVDLTQLGKRLRESRQYSPEAVREAAAALADKRDLRLDQIIPTGPGRRALEPKGFVFLHPAPGDPRTFGVQEMEGLVKDPEQILALKLRFQHLMGRDLIGAVMEKSPEEVDRLLNAGFKKVHRTDAGILRTNLMLVD